MTYKLLYINFYIKNGNKYVFNDQMIMIHIYNKQKSKIFKKCPKIKFLKGNEWFSTLYKYLKTE